MTKITFIMVGKDIQGFVTRGHSGYASKGEDIVCAAVSALTQTTVMGLTEVVQVAVDVKIDNGCLRCMLPAGVSEEQWQDSQVILKTLYKGIEAICEEYRDFVMLEEV